MRTGASNVSGDQGYTCLEKYIMCDFSKVERRALELPLGLAKRFNKMHVGYRLRVEWGISGLKTKCRCLQKRFDHLVKPTFAITFTIATLLTNFLHRRRRDMHEVIAGNYCRTRAVGWVGDY